MEAEEDFEANISCKTHVMDEEKERSISFMPSASTFKAASEDKSPSVGSDEKMGSFIVRRPANYLWLLL